MINDLRSALRALGKTRSLTVLTVLTLALGIGGSATVFSLMNALLLNPYPYPDSSRLVLIQAREQEQGAYWRTTVRTLDFFEFQRRNVSFEGMAGFGWARFTVGGGNLPETASAERMVVGRATHGFLRVLGVQPALGRFFAATEDQPGGPAVVVLSHGLWKGRFGGRADVLGQTLMVGGRPHTIIGVMPAGLMLPGDRTSALWIPAAYSISDGRWDRDSMIARLRTGVALARAQADLTRIAGQLAQEYPATDAGWEVRVLPIAAELAGLVSRPLAILSVAVGLVLLLACANLSGLWLARGVGRAREIAVRISLGATQRRLVRQMLTESLVLSLAGGVLGVLFACWATRAVAAAAPARVGLDSVLRIDTPVLAFAFGISVLTALLFGMAPAVYGSRGDGSALLGSTVRGRSLTPSRNRFLSGLVVAEFSLAVLLLVAGGLLTKSLGHLLSVQTGIRPEHLLTLEFELPKGRYPSSAARTAFYETLVERLADLPGVRSVSAGSPLPMSGQYSGDGFRIEGRPTPENWRDMSAQYCAAAPGYFRTMGIPLLSGREFDLGDRDGAPPIVIVNQTLARRYFPGEVPLGRRIQAGRAIRTIVGVVGDVRHGGPHREPGPQIYEPLLALSRGPMPIVVRTGENPDRLAGLVRGVVAGLDRDLPVDRVRTMRRVMFDLLREQWLMTALLGSFAVLALLLAAIGVYGLVSYSVSQRTHEIGVRIAVGARSAQVLALVLRKALLLAGAGVAIGIPAALAASHTLASLLYGVRPRDVAVFVLAPTVLVLVALAASLLPARRAAKVDPMVALRCE